MLLYYLSLIETEEQKLTFLHIYDKCGKQMLAVAKGILKNQENAEDAVQDAFEGIARSIHRIPNTSEAAVKAYVMTVVRNAALAIFREENKWGVRLDVDELEIASDADTFQTVADAQDYEKLLELINRLPLQYRDVLILRYVMEMKPQEIGAILHRKTTTVQQQLTRGKQALSTLYAQEVAKNA